MPWNHKYIKRKCKNSLRRVIVFLKTKNAVKDVCYIHMFNIIYRNNAKNLLQNRSVSNYQKSHLALRLREIKQNMNYFPLNLIFFCFIPLNIVAKCEF